MTALYYANHQPYVAWSSGSQVCLRRFAQDARPMSFPGIAPMLATLRKLEAPSAMLNLFADDALEVERLIPVMHRLAEKAARMAMAWTPPDDEDDDEDTQPIPPVESEKWKAESKSVAPAVLAQDLQTPDLALEAMLSRVHLHTRAVAEKLAASRTHARPDADTMYLIRTIGETKVRYAVTRWTDYYVQARSPGGKAERFYKDTVQKWIREKTVVIVGHCPAWASEDAAWAAVGRENGKTKMQQDLDVMASKAREQKARVWIKPNPTEKGREYELLDIEWGADSFTYQWKMNDSRMGLSRTEMSYETLARFLERGMARIENAELLPGDVATKLDALRKEVKPPVDWSNFDRAQLQAAPKSGKCESRVQTSEGEKVYTL